MLALIGFGLALASSSVCTDTPSDHLTGCVDVVSAERPLVDSGIFAVHAPVTVRDAQGRETTLYIIYMGKDQALPTAGDHCRFRYRLDRLGGSLGAPAGNAPYPLVEYFVCDCP